MLESTQQQHRRTGFAVILLLLAVVALTHLIQSRRNEADGIGNGIRHLDRALRVQPPLRIEELHAAEQAFGAATGTLVIEPLAILGLELGEELPRALGTPLPPTPTTLDDKAVAAHAQALLARGKPQQALEFLGQPEVRRRTGRGLAVLEQFAARWVEIRQRGDK